LRILVCDLGSTSIRVGVADRRGRIVALARRPQDAIVDDGARCEADPALWWDAFRDGAAEALQGGTADAIALTAITRTQVFVDAAGQPVRPALAWRDARATSSEAFGADDPAARPGPFDPLTRIAWLRATEPTAVARTRYVLEPKDWLNQRLTGRAATDAVTLGRLDYPPLGRDLDRRLAALGLDRALFGEIVEPTASLGKVRSGLEPPFDRLAGAPVFAGGQDTWTATLGMGACTPGCAYIVSGTSEVTGLVLDAPRAAPGLLSLPWSAGLHHIGGPSQGGLDALAWLGETTGRSIADLIAAAASAGDAPALLFHPYLQGERVPLWDSTIRGAFIGLDRRHGPGHLARAVIEGIACANRRILDAVGAPRQLRISGGGARFDLWCQTKADLLGCTVLRTDADEPGLLGCAIVALTGLGVFASIAEAQAALVGIDREFTPDPRRHALLDGLYQAFRAADRAVQDATHLLARLPDAGHMA
jgi:xylulokinase